MQTADWNNSTVLSGDVTGAPILKRVDFKPLESGTVILTYRRGERAAA